MANLQSAEKDNPLQDPMQDPTRVKDTRDLLCSGPGYTKDFASQESYYGRWLIYRNFEDLNETWCEVRDAVTSGKLGTGTIGASCSTLWYNPLTIGPGPVTTGRIGIYTTEQDYLKVGMKLVNLECIRHDIQYKTHENSTQGKFVHNSKLTKPISSMYIYWKRGHPIQSEKKKGKEIQCPPKARSLYDYNPDEDVWKLNVVSGSDTSDAYGKWVIKSNYDPKSDVNITTLWHRLKESIENKQLPVITMECPAAPNRSRKIPPEIHITTSKENMNNVGENILSVMKCDIEYTISHSGERITLKWKDDLLDQSEDGDQNLSIENVMSQEVNQSDSVMAETTDTSAGDPNADSSSNTPSGIAKNDNEFVQEIEDAVSSDKNISRKLAHGVFVGPTGAGKSSLMDRLLGKPRKLFSASTGVTESVVVVSVNLDASTLRSAIVTDSNPWEEIDFGDSVVGQIETMTQSLPAISLIKDSPPHELFSGARLTCTDTHDVSNTSHMRDIDFDDTDIDLATSVTTDSLQRLREAISQIVSRYGGSQKFKKFLEKNFSLYLRDTGGQIEFQEMLPLLVFGPSIFFFVFRLDLDFKSKFTVQYRKSEGESLNCYTSSITTEGALLEFLASVDAMDVPSEATGIKTHKPLVFIIGTHKDKLGATASESIVQLDKSLDSLIKKNGFRELVQYADRHKGQVMFTVDNTSEKEDDFQIIRSNVNSLIDGRDEFTIEYPIRYLLFCLELQDMKRSVLTLDECKAMAAKYSIEGDQVLHLLQFLHLRIGVIRYFDKDGVRHIVIKEPQFLFNAVTRLVIETFSSKALRDEEANNFEKKGILTAPVLGTAIKNVLDHNFTAEIFLQLLVHLRITALCKHQGEDEQYFIPCVLNHVPECTGGDPETDIMPLAVKFKCNHCPKGLFGVLVTHLMNPDLKKGSNIVSFTLIQEKIFKNQVSFEVQSHGVQDEMALMVYPSHLEIKFFPECSKDRHTSVPQVCTNVRHILEHSIHQSIKDLHYNEERLQLIICFRCDSCPELHEVKEVSHTKHTMYCPESRETKIIPLKGECWYNSESISSAASSTTLAQVHVSPLALSHSNVKKFLKIFTDEQLLNIGVDLGLNYVRLKNMIQNSKCSFCNDMLNCWLRGDDDVGTPSWEGLVKALEESGYNGVAAKIRDVI